MPSPSSALPWSNSLKGIEDPNLLDRFDAAIEVLEFLPEHYVAEGDSVAVFGYFKCRGRQTGNYLLEDDWAVRITIRDGKIARYHILKRCNKIYTIVVAYRQAGSGRPGGVGTTTTRRPTNPPAE